jgi:hypothetical protein
VGEKQHVDLGELVLADCPDRDRIYGGIVARRLRAMGIRDKPTAPVSPWQNGFAERLIGSIYLGPEPAGVREHGRPIIGDVVQPDAGPGVVQQLRQPGLSVQEFGALSDDASRRQQRDGPAMFVLVAQDAVQEGRRARAAAQPEKRMG